MVQIVVKVRDAFRLEAWCLVELQGKLETRDDTPCDGMHIGDLHFDVNGVPNLIIGHHLLTGKVVALEKPFAVLNKRKTVPNPLNSNEESRTEYDVIALLTQKIVFKNRPKPIVTKSAIRKVT